MRISIAKSHPLDAVFSPKSVAVLGVTPTPGTVPYDIFHNILSSGYQGTRLSRGAGQAEHLCRPGPIVTCSISRKKSIKR